MKNFTLIEPNTDRRKCHEMFSQETKKVNTVET